MPKRAGNSVQIPQAHLVDSPQPDAADPSDESSATSHVDPLISEYFAKIGKRGGLKGGKARLKLLTPEQRKEIASRGGRARAGKLTDEQRKEIARKGVLARLKKRK